MPHKNSYINDTATPMVKQYLAIKEQHQDAILFFRLGDFYEMFFDDAVLASDILDITLTSRNKKDENPIPLCGVPYHSVDPYIVKLLKNGKKVAICEQVEDPKQAKGVVKRSVTKIYTPGVVPDGDALSAKNHNFVVAAYAGSDGLGVATADISTGLFRAANLNSEREIVDEIKRIEPSEILLPDDGDYEGLTAHFGNTPITRLESEQFAYNNIEHIEGAKHVSQTSKAAAKAAGAVYHYLGYTQRGELHQISELEKYTPGDSMLLTESTKRNLELFCTIQSSDRYGSLLWLMDKTRTAMGARELRQWMNYPLMDKTRIDRRLDAVEALSSDQNAIDKMSDILSRISDLERIASRMSAGTGNARDMRAISITLCSCEELKSALIGFDGLLWDIRYGIDELKDVRKEIEKTIVDDPPMGVREGGMIREGVDDELDELISIRRDGKKNIAAMEAEERSRTGITSLKVRFNKVFGYYIEVTNTHKDKVPGDYIRKQTLTNAERYITPGLKSFEEKVLGAEDRIKALEYAIFCKLRDQLVECTKNLKRTAKAVAGCDVLVSLAKLSLENRYSRPEIVNQDVIEIEEGRHPVVESLQRAERFVPNDVCVGGEEQRFLMITGPNMAGKSTVMRQTALIVLMAQIGSFVPAAKARIGMVDRIFTRIGASDALSKGMSTFMVEMTEAAKILNEATQKSLVIIDEIGRGTSTFDGLAIAWSIAEELHDRTRARTLFATHYHELTELAATRTGIKNFQIAVKEWNDQVIFLRRMIPGATSNSYGIQVARLAGLAPQVIERAKEILTNLETGEFDEIGRPRIARKKGEEKTQASQMTLFTAHPLLDDLGEIDLSTLTPLEALNLLHRWKQKL